MARLRPPKDRSRPENLSRRAARRIGAGWLVGSILLMPGWLTLAALSSGFSLPEPFLFTTAAARAAESPGFFSPEETALLSPHAGTFKLLSDRLYFKTLIRFIREAEQSIDLAVFLFKITDSPGNRPARLLKELAAARNRGVAIRILLEKSGYNDRVNQENQRTGKALQRHGIQVVFDSPRTTLHTKVLLIDRRYVLLGSHNWTHAALAYNRETSLLLDSPPLARELSSYLDELVQ